ncbi:1-aminocyclopropane-1-carboxylate deaminase/D-cysteine desulfhydrase [Hymenobacter sp. BT186]|uniref:1-aminocyclopropane-1-carboxylate deaminase/D-cysteine desulfhydrase n=1 Tax=Hymenobacter telluris TaxID=2816474 RepID=A0A939EX21_9BACT|nr:pyridoxal-phosphate dependent enzyme [Hymenobacter telluris]MBO0358205.1 1-aminocyclopropane-1-carboxylate deaminase/D-cysteine desulfhydrase [Hymenobacter telluris]MBW3374231.1 pyridoxal-phosphate dependent enzyme [Hymenobacter norwichensis]
MILQPIAAPEATRRNIRLLLLRDDLAHPKLPGNKWRKLKYNLMAARQAGHHTLLTFGGSFSNHIAAVAAAGRLHNFRTIGLIRGEETQPLNPTLARATADGMQLRYLNRTSYRRKQDPAFLAELLHETGPAYLIPEGGSNALALPGCAELVTELAAATSFDYLCVACGTGGTLAGLLAGMAGQGQAVGVATLKGGEFLRTDINQLTQTATGRTYLNYDLRTDYHLGGYAHFSPELLRFIQEFEATYGILLDPIYTGKLLYAIFDLLRQDYFAPNSTVIAVHTGGLQGWTGFQQRFGNRSAWWPTVV